MVVVLVLQPFDGFRVWESAAFAVYLCLMLHTNHCASPQSKSRGISIFHYSYGLGPLGSSPCQAE